MPSACGAGGRPSRWAPRTDGAQVGSGAWGTPRVPPEEGKAPLPGLQPPSVSAHAVVAGKSFSPSSELPVLPRGPSRPPQDPRAPCSLFPLLTRSPHHQSDPRPGRTRLPGGMRGATQAPAAISPSRKPGPSGVPPHAGDLGTRTVPLTQPKKKARWEPEAAEATGGPRQQDPRPPWDCRHHSKVSVADPSPRTTSWNLLLPWTGDQGTACNPEQQLRTRGRPIRGQG